MAFNITNDFMELFRADREHAGAAYESFLAGLDASSALRSNIHALAALVPTTSRFTDQHVVKLLRKCDLHLDTQAVVQAELLERIPPLSRKTFGSSALADQVFATPEILEQILLELPAVDILSAYSVSKTFFNNIEASIKLQRKLGLTPDHKSCFCVPTESLFFHMYGRSVSGGAADDGDPFGPGESDETKRSFNFGLSCFDGALTQEPYALGSRCANMLVCQPPVRRMDVFAACCEGPYFAGYAAYPTIPQPSLTITSKIGITLAQVMDAISVVRKEHLLCPDASVRDHDAEGFVRVEVDLQGTVTLRSDDPAFDRLRAPGHFGGDGDAEKIDAARLRPYIAAKQIARDNGEQIPTLAEFEEAQANYPF